MYSIKRHDSFSEQVDHFVAGKIMPGNVIEVLKTPSVLKILGADNLPIVMTYNTMEKVIDRKHGLSPEMIKQLPNQISDPIMVFDSATQPDSLVIMTELIHDGKTVVAAIRLSKTMAHHEVNEIISIHPREKDGHFIGWIQQGLLRYQNRQKSREWFRSRGLRLPKEETATRDFKNKILHETDIVKDKYSTESAGTYQLPTLADVQDVFKGQEVSEINGGFLIKTHAGEVFVESVNSIDANTAALNIGYSKGKLSEKEVIAGKYDKGVISLVKGAADKFTLSHESVHYMEDIGVISPSETSLLKRHIQNLVSDGKFETVNEKDIGGAEDRANFLADALTRPPKGLLGRILNKIHDFIDKLVNAFGIRTIRGITRDVETGNIYSRENEAQREAWLDLNTESYNTATMAEPFYSQLFNTVTSKIKEMPSKVQSIVPWLNKNNVKPAEMKWMGVEQWLRENAKDGRIDKQAFADFLKENQIEIKEVTKGVGTWKGEEYFVNGNREANVGYSDGEGWYFESDTSEGTEIFETKAEAMKAAEEDIIGAYGKAETKYASYQLPGGENYKELLLTLPVSVPSGAREAKNQLGDFWDRMSEKYGELPQTALILKMTDAEKEERRRLNAAVPPEPSPYRSAHWEEPNVVAHVRMNDRFDEDGNKVLFLEEVQSDWHQEGKKKGYNTGISKEEENEIIKIDNRINELMAKAEPYLEKGEDAPEELRSSVYKLKERRHALEIKRDTIQGVPPAPFSDNWHEMVMKRMLRYAAENGYDKIAWTTGEQQAERYDLSKHLDRIEYEPAFVKDGSGKEIPNLYEFIAYDKSGKQIIHEDEIGLNRIEELAGKEIAQRIKDDVGEAMSDERPYRDWRKLTGLDLKVGGEGMKSFYDNLIPGFMNKYVKQWGAKVGEIMIPASEPLERGYLATATVPSVDITDQMKHDVLFKGQSFYNVAGNKNWQWWKNRDWQKEMLALPKKFWEGLIRTRFSLLAV